MDKIRLISRDARLTIAVWMFWAFSYGINDVLFNLILLETGYEETFIGFFLSLSIPFLLTLVWSPVKSIAKVGFVGRALFMNIAWPVMDVFYVEGLTKSERSTAMGVINSGDSLSRAVGLNIGGWLLGAGFLRAPFVLATVLYSASIVLFYYFFGKTTIDRIDEKDLFT